MMRELDEGASPPNLESTSRLMPDSHFKQVTGRHQMQGGGDRNNMGGRSTYVKQKKE